ncbi:hypothetical protein PV11_06694 [Exophiala sideris]|uniref:Uncharacterized protein n=1 Tax=Exophiala sideris TaxID=1016849 RepID=A0A0D1YEB0_9EURO|nr:hypothetical protein PV11_06694 [Exophiala sideris]
MGFKMLNLRQRVAYVPWQTSLTIRPIEQLLNAPAELQKDLARAWKDGKLAELSFVGLAGALISGVYASAFSWYNIPPQPWTLKSSWYSGLLFALVSICIATQQSVALHRLASNEDGLLRLCTVLSYKQAGRLQPRYLQIFIWQASVMLLNISIFLFLLGLVILVYQEVVSGSEVKLTAVVFTIAGVFGSAIYLTSTIALYWAIGGSEVG